MHHRPNNITRGDALAAALKRAWGLNPPHKCKVQTMADLQAFTLPLIPPRTFTQLPINPLKVAMITYPAVPASDKHPPKNNNLISIQTYYIHHSISIQTYYIHHSNWDIRPPQAWNSARLQIREWETHSAVVLHSTEAL
jgi:hypothetical protein